MRILFITPAPPWPGRRGFQMRVAGLATELVARDHEVIVLAQRAAEGSSRPPPPGIDLHTVVRSRRDGLRGLLRRPGCPLQVGLHHQPAFGRAVAETAARLAPDVAVVVLSRLGWTVPALDVPVVLDLVDALALNMAQRAERQPVLGPLWRWEARRMARWDGGLLRRVAAATVVSVRDRDALLDRGGDGAAPVHVVPLGLRLDDHTPPAGAAAGPPVVVTTGNLGYFPTVDGVGWFAREVWPRVRRRQPEAMWWLAGSRPTRTVRRLARVPGVRLIVDPADLRTIRRRARVAVAPLFAGSGTPIKILEAMADGVPVVTTPKGAAGLDALEGEELRIHGRPEAFATAVAALLGDPELGARQAEHARAWLAARHGRGPVAARFEEILRSVCSTSGRR